MRLHALASDDKGAQRGKLRNAADEGAGLIRAAGNHDRRAHLPHHRADRVLVVVRVHADGNRADARGAEVR